MLDQLSNRTRGRLAVHGSCDAYDADRSRVDAAYGRMRAVAAAPHAPGQARAAATGLTEALEEATARLSRLLRVAGPRPECSAERVRLAELDGWLQRLSLDDLGVVVPTTVRVGSRAATGPHIAGMVAEPDDPVAARVGEPAIGIDLRGVVDSYGPDASTAGRP